MKKALLVVDVQNDFCPGGSYPVPGGNKVIKPLNEVIDFAQKNGWLVFVSRDWHSEKLFSVGICGNRHCIQDTEGARFHPKLKINDSVTIISKGADNLGKKHYSAFNGDKVSLNKLLKEAGVDEIYIGGLAFDYCVKNTALDAVKRGYRVNILLDATKAIKNSDKEVIMNLLLSEKSIDLRKGLISDKAFWRWLQEELPEGYDANLIKREWYDGYRIDKDILGLMKKLKGKYKLIAFSGNVESRVEFLDRKYHFRKYFEKEVYSYDYHLIKPQKEFVQVMINASGVKPQEIVYFDDEDKHSSVAKAFAVNVVIYKRGEVKKVVKKLEELGVKI